VALRSPTQHHAYWGIFATSGDLPNVAGAATQSPTLQVGDQAYSQAEAALYCYDGAAWRLATPASLIARTTLTAPTLVTYTVPTGANLQAINLNSDGVKRFARVDFVVPASGQVLIEAAFDCTIVNSAAVQYIGLHTSSTTTNKPDDGCYRVNADNDSVSGQFYAQFYLSGLTPGNVETRYFLAACNFSGNTIRASSYQATYTPGADLPAPFVISVYDLGFVVEQTNPSS